MQEGQNEGRKCADGSRSPRFEDVSSWFEDGRGQWAKDSRWPLEAGNGMG